MEFAANSTIRMNYGKLSDLIFKAERDGTIKPYFSGQKHQKEFEISTRDWNDKHRGLTKLHNEDWYYAGKKYHDKYDPLRDWYLFSDKGRQQMYEDLVKGENLQKYREHIDDRKDDGAYTRSLLDLHDGIAFIEKWTLIFVILLCIEPHFKYYLNTLYGLKEPSVMINMCEVCRFFVVIAITAFIEYPFS